MARLQGTTLADTLTGGLADDLIFGGDGADFLAGGAGNDVLYGYGSGASAANQAISATRIASGLALPVFMTQAPDDTNRAFVLELHTGQIEILNLDTNAKSATPFLDIGTIISKGGEQGLLGLAFHPDFASNGKFYINYTDVAGATKIVEYSVSASNPDVADPSSARELLTVNQPFANHNGGWLGFGPDGMLYIALGDGGSGGDPANRAQNVDDLLGKMLRIDVNTTTGNLPYGIPADNPFVGVAGRDEIWATGLRNPWRPSFDSFLGDLWIADVGQGNREEINVQQAGSSGGQNYGWNWREGFLPYPTTLTGNQPPNLIDPIHDYAHVGGPSGGFSVTGGYVFRGQVAGLEGEYFFADYVSNQIWSLIEENGALVRVVNRTNAITPDVGTVNQISSFAQDRAGNLYILGLDGEIHRLNVNESRVDAGNILVGGDGNDRAYGGTGNDALFGDRGNDTLNAGAGADTLQGGVGNDVLEGEAGADFLVGGDGNDQLFAHSKTQNTGSSDGDTLIGGLGDDRLTGALGNDWLYGGDGYDFLNGNGGNDVLIGDGGFNELFGGADNDYLFGGSATNVLDGGDGADVLQSFGLDDTLVGGAGNDFFYRNANGASTIYGGSGVDQFNGGNATSADVFFGGDDSDYAFGGSGNDSLVGGHGNDVLIGQAGNDTLEGGAGVNLLWANDAGNDQIRVNVADGGTQVVDFFEAGGTNDVVRLIGSNLTNFAGIQALVTNIGVAQNGNLMVNAGSGAQLYLNLGANQTAIWFQGVSAYSLTSADFLFGP
jgi:Ca2+-binding RTX toxin-like protein